MAYTTIYTSNINYPTNYYRAYVEYQLTESATSVTVDMKYGVALHSGYVSTSWEQVSRQVACSIGTGHDSSKASSYDIYNGAWVTDSTQLGKTADGKSWWHETGTASKTINKTTSAQTLYVMVWGKVNGVQGTNYATITIPRLARVNVTYHVNGGTIADNPHKYSNSLYFKVVSNYINSSTTSNGTYSVFTSHLSRGTAHYDTYNYASFGLTRTGYHRNSTKEWNTNSSGTGTNYNQDDTSSNTVNSWSTSRLNGGTEISSDVNVVLYANWLPNTYTITYDANGGTGTTPVSTHTYGQAKMVSTNGFTKEGYTFIGWNRDQEAANQGIIEYSPTYLVPANYNSTDGANITFYAVWVEFIPEYKAWGRTDADWQGMNKLWALKDGQWREIISAWVLKGGIWRSAFGSGSSVIAPIMNKKVSLSFGYAAVDELFMRNKTDELGWVFLNTEDLYTYCDEIDPSFINLIIEDYGTISISMSDMNNIFTQWFDGTTACSQEYVTSLGYTVRINIADTGTTATGIQILQN